MQAELAPHLAPDILEDMKVVELNVGLRVDRLDRVSIGWPMINVKGFQLEPEPFEPLQKGPDVLLVTLFDFLRGDDSTVFIFEHDDTALHAQRKDFIEMSLGHWLLLMQQFDDL